MVYYKTEIQTILQQMLSLDLIDEIPQIGRYDELKELLCEIMDSSEESALQGLDILLSHNSLKSRFRKAEIHDYIEFCAEYYTATSNRHNPLRAILKAHKYPYKFE